MASAILLAQAGFFLEEFEGFKVIGGLHDWQLPDGETFVTKEAELSPSMELLDGDD